MNATHFLFKVKIISTSTLQTKTSVNTTIALTHTRVNLYTQTVATNVSTHRKVRDSNNITYS